MDVTALNVRLNQLERNVDALVNQSASSTSPIAGARQIMLVLATRTKSSWGVSTFTGVAPGTTGITGFGGEVDIGGGNLTFLLGRTQSVLIVGSATAVEYMTVVAPQLIGSPIYVRVVNQSNSFGAGINQNLATTGNAGSAAPTGATVTQQLPSLAAGTYTVNLWWNSANAANENLDLYSYNLTVFQLGN